MPKYYSNLAKKLGPCQNCKSTEYYKARSDVTGVVSCSECGTFENLPFVKTKHGQMISENASKSLQRDEVYIPPADANSVGYVVKKDKR